MAGRRPLVHDGQGNLQELAAPNTLLPAIVPAPGQYPKHGTTLERTALGITLTSDDNATGWPFYDLDQDILYFWSPLGWIPLQTSASTGPRDYYGTAAEVLPQNYVRGDRWTDSEHDCVVHVCRAAVNTHSLADWKIIGRQG